jgi:hypothetical protein
VDEPAFMIIMGLSAAAWVSVLIMTVWLVRRRR